VGRNDPCPCGSGRKQEHIVDGGGGVGVVHHDRSADEGNVSEADLDPACDEQCTFPKRSEGLVSPAEGSSVATWGCQTQSW
jgi:hypothetical protein